MKTRVFKLKLTDGADNEIDEYDVTLYSDGTQGDIPTRERLLASIYGHIADGQDADEVERIIRAGEQRI